MKRASGDILRETLVMNEQVVANLRGDVVAIMADTTFVFIGLTACCIAVIRRRTGFQFFLWLGVWSAFYGGSGLLQSNAVLSVAPQWLRVGAPFAERAMSFSIIVAASLAFVQVTRGIVKKLISGVSVVGFAIAVAAMAVFAATGTTGRMVTYNSALAACSLVLLMTVAAVPRLSRECLLLSDRRVLLAGMLIFSLQALFVNVSRPFGFKGAPLLDNLAFAILLFSFGYVGLQLVLAGERRLIEVENELAVAREIQTAILPRDVPQVQSLQISAMYRPMAAVAGDFYDFLPVDGQRAGFLVADVSGHGVPAALIASMVKVGVHTVSPAADDPAAVLDGLNRILSSQASGQLVSAAYLWIDMQARQAAYAAAGHPPLLHWSQGRLRRVESNGLLFGVTHENGGYPVYRFPIAKGDRLLLYTDGVTEPEDAQGVAFGDSKLEQVIRANESVSTAELGERLLAEIRSWQPDGVSQQDDMTLVVIDAK